MKKTILIILFLFININARNIYKDYRAIPLEKTTLLENGKDKMFCSICGMKLPMFYKTNHSAKHQGKNHQYCSIVCLIEDMLINNKNMTDFRVVDNSTLKFISSKDAFFIVGSKKPGTMSVISKYAFGTKKEAIKFKNQNGGEIMDFTKLVELVKKSQAKNIAKAKKAKEKAIKKGKIIYKRICKKTNKSFKSITQAKIFLKDSGICGDINSKKLDSISLYLKERKK